MYPRSEFFKNPLQRLVHLEGTCTSGFSTAGLKSMYHSREDNRSGTLPYARERADVMKREGITVRLENDSSKGKVVNEAGKSRAKYWKVGCAAR